MTNTEEEVESLKLALRQCASAVGGVLSPECSTEFHCSVAEEVKLYAAFHSENIGKTFKLNSSTWVPASAILFIKHHGHSGSKSSWDEWEVILMNGASFKLSIADINSRKSNLATVLDMGKYYGIPECLELKGKYE